ncbi:MAG: flavodoxin domain-containing protein [Acidimicrobiia bacterium]
MAEAPSVLVTAASKHGATAEIADAIAAELAANGMSVTRLEPDQVDGVEPYDAVVLGSAVYAGRWHKDARRLVDDLAGQLENRAVFLFSSGPIGDPPMPDSEPVDSAEIVASTSAVDHRVFAGALEQSRLNFGERAIVAALRAEYGDFRDWDEIRAWARGIAIRLGSVDG